MAETIEEKLIHAIEKKWSQFKPFKKGPEEDAAAVQWAITLVNTDPTTYKKNTPKTFAQKHLVSILEYLGPELFVLCALTQSQNSLSKYKDTAELVNLFDKWRTADVTFPERLSNFAEQTLGSQLCPVINGIVQQYITRDRKFYPQSTYDPRFWADGFAPSTKAKPDIMRPMKPESEWSNYLTLAVTKSEQLERNLPSEILTPMKKLDDWKFDDSKHREWITNCASITVARDPYQDGTFMARMANDTEWENAFVSKFIPNPALYTMLPDMGQSELRIFSNISCPLIEEFLPESIRIPMESSIAWVNERQTDTSAENCVRSTRCLSFVVGCKQSIMMVTTGFDKTYEMCAAMGYLTGNM